MHSIVLLLRQPSDSDLERVLAGSRHAEVSYEEVGATRSADLPAGYRRDRYQRQLGSERGCFERAVDALHGWQAHAGAGVRIFPDGATVEAKGTVLFVLRTLGLWTIAPCRVVYVIDEPLRFSFGYGTLPGHPEGGEVAMTVSREDASVVARIDSFSRTVDPLARAAFPVTRVVQKRMTNRYLEALAAASAPSDRSVH
jgi:uncharacterized protein (UPF0548 family)